MFERREIAVLGALLTVFLLVTLILGPLDAANQAEEARLTSFGNSRNGARALYLTLEEVGIPVGRLERGYLGRDLPAGPIALLAPSRGMAPEEIGELMAWLREGGRLIYSPRTVQGIVMSDGILDSLGLRPSSAIRLGEDLSLEIPDTPPTLREHRWTRDLDALPGPTVVIYTRNDSIDFPAEAVVARDSGSVVSELTVGAGRAVVWAPAQWLSNGSLREAPSPAALFARIAAELTAEGDTLLFDEYHHGFQEGGGPLRVTLRFFGTTPLGRGTLYLTALGLLAIVFGGVRFGRADPSPRGRRRSPMEHAEALANAYRKAGAVERMERLLWAGLARRVGVRAPPDDSGGLVKWIEGLPLAPAARRRLAGVAGKLSEEGLADVATAIDTTLTEGAVR